MKKTTRRLTRREIKRLEKEKCTAEDWSTITVTADFDPHRYADVHFSGRVYLGSCSGNGGIYHARIHECTIGNDVLIRKIGGTISRYSIEDNARILSTGSIAVTGSTTFGNGQTVTVLDETGSIEVPLCDYLSAPWAYIMALYPSTGAAEKLKERIDLYAESVRSDMGVIGKGARIEHCGVIENVKTGPGVLVRGALELINGTVNSSEDDPAQVGSGVIARDFIFSTGSTVKDHAVLSRVFIGQGALVGGGTYGSHCLFFANSEALNGEAVSVFAGPYTVTHHRSSLLIAGMFSFFNTGSGTNMSNHNYKTGPVHFGITERGCKTASNAHVVWPSRIGAYTFIKGSLPGGIDTASFPFSYLYRENGKSMLLPGMNIKTIGTYRDAVKWPKRDRRKGGHSLDPIEFRLFSPYIGEKLLRGLELLTNLKQKSPEGSRLFFYNSVYIPVRAIHKGIDYYTMGLTLYTGRYLALYAETGSTDAVKDLLSGLAQGDVQEVGGISLTWIDAAGAVVPERRFLMELEHNAFNLAAGETQSMISRCLAGEEPRLWKEAASLLFGGLDLTGKNLAHRIVNTWIDAEERLYLLRLQDAEKESHFGAFWKKEENPVDRRIEQFRDDLDRDLARRQRQAEAVLSRF